MQVNRIMQTQNQKTTFQAKVNLLMSQNKTPFTKKEIHEIKAAAKNVDTFKKVTVKVTENANKITEHFGIVYDKYNGHIEFTCKRPDNTRHTYSTEYTRIEPGETKGQFVANRIIRFLEEFNK